jgi:integrase/recombinase XerD
MALEQVFVDPRALKRFREGPLASVLDGFCEWLHKCGFMRLTIRHHISNVSHFSRFLEQQKLTNPTTLNSDHIRRFTTEHLPRCKHRRPGAKHYHRVAFSIHRFMEYLQQCGFVDATSHHCAPYQSLLAGYIKWMKDVQHSASGTLQLRRQYLIRFLLWLGSDVTPEKLSTLSPDKIQTFFLDYSREHGRAARRSMQAALRTFLRFCQVQGYIKRDLAVSVPTLRTYKLDTLPRGIADKEARRLLSSIDRKTDTGRRDYAIIQLLYTYGIRGGQLRALRLRDITWAQSQIRFAPLKHGKEIVQPLTDNVGESLLDYLQNSRPPSSYPEVFLTSRAPYRPLQYSTTLSEIIARNMRAATIPSPTQGAHTFRHGFATRMLGQGYPLKYIADMIGHRCIQTTSIYTKVDFQTLNHVALDWPEEVL